MTGAAQDHPEGGVPEEPVSGAGGVSDADAAAVGAQLGRQPRGMAAVAHRCPCSLPDVVATRPRLPDGSPFPTTFYLTCPRAASAVGTLESSGLMAQMTRRIAEDPELAAAQQGAHEDYLSRRAELGEVPEIAGVSAGGLPSRVKCLHALLAHSLAAGRGVDPLGDEVQDLLGAWWEEGPCVDVDAEAHPGGATGEEDPPGDADQGRVSGTPSSSAADDPPRSAG